MKSHDEGTNNSTGSGLKELSQQPLKDGISYVSVSSDSDSDSDSNYPKRRRYQLRATTPGFHYIGEPGKSPMAWAGPGPSSFGYITNAQKPELPLNNKLAKCETLNKDSKSDKLEDDREEDHREEVVEENEAESSLFWIPYQEGRPSGYFSSHGESLIERTSVPFKRVKYTHQSQKSRYQDIVDKSGNTESEGPFVHLAPKEILQHMLGCVEDYHSEVYTSHLRRYEESQVNFMEFLLPEARQVLESGNYTLANLLSIGAKSPGRIPKKGVYLHILWYKRDPSIFFLYVGQSFEVPVRLSRHRDPNYRSRNPSLHYFVWDRGIDQEEFMVDEAFVFLAEVDSDDPNLLNLLEMWCSLMLQTLTKNALLKYQPENGVAPYAGKHLNVALPLHQRPNKILAEPQDPSIFHSLDPLVHLYYASLRRRFYELKFSPNPSARAYYDSVIRQRVISRVKRYTPNVQELCNGLEVEVSISQDKRWNSFIQLFCLSYFRFIIPKAWGHLEEKAPIQVRPELITEEELKANGRIPNVYCLRATNQDPASRLALFIEGTFADGVSFAGWLRSRGEDSVLQMNSFVDMLEGATMLEVSKRSRRWWSLKHNDHNGRIKKVNGYNR